MNTVGLDGVVRPMTAAEEAEYYSLFPEPSEITERDRLLSAISQKRWDVETGGLTLPNGMKVKTGTADQNRISSMVSLAAAGVIPDTMLVDFKAESGWADATIADVKVIAGAIAMHVQACFTAQRLHETNVQELFDAGNTAGLQNYNINTDWPQ